MSALVWHDLVEALAYIRSTGADGEPVIFPRRPDRCQAHTDKTRHTVIESWRRRQLISRYHEVIGCFRYVSIRQSANAPGHAPEQDRNLPHRKSRPLVEAVHPFRCLPCFAAGLFDGCMVAPASKAAALS